MVVNPLRTGLEVIFFSCSSKLSIKFQLLIKTETLKKIGMSLKLSYDIFIPLINVTKSHNG